jgi:hypothetical protein
MTLNRFSFVGGGQVDSLQYVQTLILFKIPWKNFVWES